jgi:hypothetical protein
MLPTIVSLPPNRFSISGVRRGCCRRGSGFGRQVQSQSVTSLAAERRLRISAAFRRV